MLTAAPATTTPTQYGVPVTTVSTSPAALNCGTRYRVAMTSTTTAESLRNPADPNRASAKSGTVSAPVRRIGAATSASIAMYPAVKPTPYQSAPIPSFSTRPATPRKDAADRYSPDTAAALSVGEIRREATRKSEVLRIAATPRAPISSVTSTTSTIAAAITAVPGGARPAPRGAPANPRAARAPGRAARPPRARTPAPRRPGPRRAPGTPPVLPAVR